MSQGAAPCQGDAFGSGTRPESWEPRVRPDSIYERDRRRGADARAREAAEPAARSCGLFDVGCHLGEEAGAVGGAVPGAAGAAGNIRAHTGGRLGVAWIYWLAIVMAPARALLLTGTRSQSEWPFRK